MRRRDFLRGTAVAGLGAVAPIESRAQTVRPDPGLREVRNLIFLVYDGFSWENLAVAQHYVSQHQGRTLALERLLALGSAGSMLTPSLSSVVTDSSSAATVWATGRRTANANVGMFPDGRRLTNILELAKAQGRAVGLITTTRVTHATPAGFAAHVLDRDWEDEIAAQYLDLAPEVILGGGSRHFSPQTRKDGQDLFARFARAGYTLVQDADELDAADQSRVLGTFAPSHLPFEIDRLFQGEGGPSLAHMTRRGLELLSRSPRGFVVQVEAGRIDHANHNNDPAAMLYDVLAADETLEVILGFADRNPDTLVIFASDHGTGGGAVFGIGKDYDLSSQTLELISRRKASYDFLVRQLGRPPEPLQVQDLVKRLFSTEISTEQAVLIAEALTGTSRMPFLAAYNQQPENTVAWALAHSHNFFEPDHLNVHYAAGSHTAGPVPIALYGAGAEEARLGLVDNTAVFYWMTTALGTRHENPVMSEAECREVLRAATAAAAG